MEEQRIKSISEAFSMQPAGFSVIEEEPIEGTKHLHIKEIKREMIQVASDPDMYYVGYNWNGDKMFQYLASSVNVRFFIDNR